MSCDDIDDLFSRSRADLFAAKATIDSHIIRLHEATERVENHHTLNATAGLPADIFSGRRPSYDLDQRSKYYSQATAKLANLRLELESWLDACKNIEERLQAQRDVMHQKMSAGGEARC